MKAPAATRSYDTVEITVGMLGIPVHVFTETTGGDRMTSLFSEAGNPVGNKQYDKVTGQDLTRDQVISMVNTPAGPVYVDPAEVEAEMDLPTKTIAIQAFYPLDQRDQYLPKAFRSIEAAQARTSKGKRDNLHAQQRVAALLRSMTDAGVMAYGLFTTRGQTYPVLIFGDGMMWELHYAENVRERRPQVDVEPPAQMLADTKDLIERLLDPAGQPDLTNHRHEVTMAIAERKAQEPPQTAPTHDPDALIQALKDSIARTKERAA